MSEENDIQDILDLCKLNLMKEFEQDHALEAIELKRKQLANKIAKNGLSFSEEQIKKHRKEFTTDAGKYPPEQEDLFMVEGELKECGSC